MKLYTLPHDDDNEVTAAFCLYYKLHNHTLHPVHSVQ